MLPGFLTTALEMIIILDVCGAIAYFAITGLARMKDKRETLSSKLQTASPGLPAFAAEGYAVPAMARMPARISSAVYRPVSLDASPAAPQQIHWTAGLKQRISKMTGKFTYRPTPSGDTLKMQSIDSDYARLGRVLDSFKEET
jgi:hypothetical protein